MKHLLLTTALGLALAAPAHATITFSATNSPTGDEQTVQFETGVTGSSVTGDSNKTQTLFTFSTLTNQTFTVMGLGQASLDCVTNCINGSPPPGAASQLNSMEIKIASGFGMTDFIGNLDFGEGTFDVTAVDQMSKTFTFMLTNGSNFFTLDAINGEVITDIQIKPDASSPAPSGFNDFQQPRVSGVCTMPAGSTTCTPLADVPEPGALALLGTALAALGFIRWRRKPT
jgi:hypothetical protein